MILGTDVILTTKAHSNIDALYGPYFIGSEGNNPGNYKLFDDFTKLETFIYSYKSLGLTVGIINEDGEVNEYWFLNEENLENPGEFNLVLTEKGIPTKLRLVSLTVSPVYDSLTDSYTVTLEYGGIGRAVGALVRFYRDNRPLTAPLPYSLDGGKHIIENEQIGPHTYKVEIIDQFANKTEAIEDRNIGILLLIKTDSFNKILNLSKITVNTLSNLNNTFSLKLRLLLENIRVAIVGISESDNIGEEILQLNVDDTLKDVTINLTDKDILGKTLYLKAYDSSKADEAEVYSFKLFTVLDSTTLFVNSVKNNQIFVENSPLSVTFIFESGADTITNIMPADDSDFTFSTISTLNFGTSSSKLLYPIKITPKSLRSDVLKNENANIIFQYSDNRTTSPIKLGTIYKYVESERYKSWNDLPDYNNYNYNSCFIDFTSDALYPSERDDKIIVKFNDKMYITNDVIHVNNIEVATPLYEDEPVYIGMGYGIRDENPSGNLTMEDNFRYDCISINGTIVGISSYDTISRARLEDWQDIENYLENLNIKSYLGNNCKGIIVSNDGTDDPISLYDDIKNKFLFETNYYLDKGESSESLLPTLTLEALSESDENYSTVLSSFESYTWDDKFRNVTFGTIEDGHSKYDVSTFNSWDDEITSDDGRYPIKLLKISTKLKEKLDSSGKSLKILKRWGVLCHYTFNDGVLEKEGHVIAYTQGTSTLTYPIPNFRLNFNESIDFMIPGVSESYFTAKADYMESAHLNNTPLAMLYNKVMKSSQIIDSYKSPAIINNMCDAILGIPVVLNIKDKNNNMINLGSFMLNTDKESKTMGLDLGNPILGIISLEGHSNTALETAARFIYSGEITEDSLKEDNEFDIDKVKEFLENSIEERVIKSNDDSETEDELWLKFYLDYWRIIANNITNNNDIIEYNKNLNGAILPNAGLSQDLADAFNVAMGENKSEGETLTPELSELYNKTLPNAITKTIDEILNLQYCYVYIIFLMVFGMTDNLGKNCMFDIWKINGEWGKMHPRFYDLDSSLGLDNGGQQTILPFSQVKDWIPEAIRNLVDATYGEALLSYKYIKNHLMYRYASSDSKLWLYIFNEKMSEIKTLYKNLREDLLSYDNLIEFFEDTIIKVIPPELYNLDFTNKYLGSTSYLHFMYGNRWTNFKDWLRARLAFCDSLFLYKYPEILTYQTISEVSAEYMFPAYLSHTTMHGTVNWGFGQAPIVKDAGGTGDVRTDFYIADAITLKTSIYSSQDYGTLEENNCEFPNLTTLTLGGSSMPNLSTCINLKTLIIESTCNISEQIVIPKSVKTLLRRNSSIPTITPPTILNIVLPEEDSELETIDVSYVNLSVAGQTSNLELNLNNLTNLKSLKLLKCIITKTLIFPKSTLNFESKESTFNGITVGEDTTLTSLDLSNQTINQLNLQGTINRLDLYNSIINNQTLDLSDAKGIKVLNLIGSNIQTVFVGNNTFKEKEPGSENYIPVTSLKLGVLQSSLKAFKLKSDVGNTVNLDIFEEINGNIKSIIYTTGGLNPYPVTAISKVLYNSSNGTYTNENGVSLEQNGLSFAWTDIEEVKVTSNSFVIDNPIIGFNIFTRCLKLTSVTCAYPTYFSSDWIFAGDKNLGSLTKVKLLKFKGAYTDVGEGGITYPTIESTIEKNIGPSDFSFFMAMSKISSPITINGNNYPNISKAYKMFMKSHEGTFRSLPGSLGNITISSPFTLEALSNTAVEVFSMFSGISSSRHNLTITSSLFTNDSYLYVKNTSSLFYCCTLDNINELYKFTKLTSASSMYAGAIINSLTFTENKITPITLDNDILGATFDLHSIFNNTRFTGVNKIIIDDFIKNLKFTVVRLECSFFNCKNTNNNSIAVLESDLILNSMTNTVYINGFLGLEITSVKEEDLKTKIIWKPEFKFWTNNNYYGGRDAQVIYPHSKGPFSARSIIQTVSTILLGNSSSPDSILLDYYFYGVKFYGSTDIIIHKPASIEGLCWKAENIGNVTIPSKGIIFSAKRAFRECKFVSGTFSNSSIMDKVSDAEEMFAGSNLIQITFNLTNTVTKVRSMFNQCRHLREGIPSNFYTNLNPNVTDFTQIFYGTAIAYTGSLPTNIELLPTLAIRVNGALACISAPQSSTGVTYEANTINITCPSASSALGLCAGSSNDISFIILNLGGNVSTLDLSYGFTYRDYKPSEISGLTTKLSLSNVICTAMYAKYAPSADTIPSGVPLSILEALGSFYNWSDANAINGKEVTNNKLYFYLNLKTLQNLKDFDENAFDDNSN